MRERIYDFLTDFKVAIREAPDETDKSRQREILFSGKVWKTREYFVYPQGVCRIRKPACAGNGCAILPVFQTEG